MWKLRFCRYGNAVSVQRTVRGFAAAGFAGILLEDQVAPKSCGHVRGKQVVRRKEAISRVRAAADARCGPALLSQGSLMKYATCLFELMCSI